LCYESSADCKRKAWRWFASVGYSHDMTLEECRRFFAEEVRFAAHLTSPALVEAFARVPRENFLGPGPWKIASADLGTGSVVYTTTADADPRHVYHNVPISLDVARDLNNGQPGSLAHWIDALALRPGERVFHLGCGVGYFTAILSEVVGATGQVLASEVDPDLAARAQQNLSPYRNVEVQCGDGAAIDPGECDAILINAGVTHPLPLWLDRLRPGGRMILPLTMPMGRNLGKGIMAMITREQAGFSARFVTFVAIYSCASVRDAQIESVLAKSLTTGILMKLKSVRRDQHEQTETCAVHLGEVCLSTAPLSAGQSAA
jgi:protein-L-isoaspartate(D-aspartate) O-methyltransferase